MVWEVAGWRGQGEGFTRCHVVLALLGSEGRGECPLRVRRGVEMPQHLHRTTACGLIACVLLAIGTAACGSSAGSTSNGGTDASSGVGATTTTSPAATSVAPAVNTVGSL